jgi:tetratricopeptide (TPR) repeat protein
MNSISAECDQLYRIALDRFEGGRLQEAVAACSALGARYPRFADGWYISSVLAQRLGNLAKALEFIDRALAIDPRSALHAVRKASVLLALSRRTEAAALVAMVDHPSGTKGGSSMDLRAAGALATYYTHAGEHERALRHYRAIGKARPDSATNLYNLAATGRILGNLTEAEHAYDAALTRDPSNWEAYYLRSGLRRQTMAWNHLPEIEAALDRVPADDVMGRAYVCYALAKELEDLGENDRSFAALDAGAKARRAGIRYDVADDLGAIDAIIASYSAETIAALIHKGGHGSAEPIFILGLPRTGTTLVERILSSHSAVYPAGELNNFAGEMGKAVQALAHGKPLAKPAMIDLSLGLDFAALGRAYVESTRPQTGHTAHFVDKMPLNHLYCGLIAAALPNARMIELVRHPLDTCYAIYKQLFTSAYPFSYDLGEIADYYLAYQRLMAHWHHVLPGRIHRLPYEALIADQQGETAKLLAFCALDHEAACDSFEKNGNSCSTASAAQVREKIYASSVGKWRHFAEQLGPLADRLRAGGIPC